jgi:hypothetical protein
MSLVDEYENFGPAIVIANRLERMANALKQLIARERQKLSEKIRRSQLLQQKILMGDRTVAAEYNTLRNEIIREMRLLEIFEDDLATINMVVNNYLWRYEFRQRFKMDYRTLYELVTAIENHTIALMYGMSEQDYMALRPRFRNMLRVLMTI